MRLVVPQPMEGTMQKSDDILSMIANAEIAPPVERAAEIALPNMRGACVNVGNVVHTLFRMSRGPGVTSANSAPGVAAEGA